MRIETMILSAVLGVPPAPPVDLIQISRDLGVIDILPTTFRDGFTDFGTRSPVIYLNRTDDSARMRFILAHELAHVLLRLPEVAELIAIQECAGLLADEEKFADRIAGTLLVPDAWIDALRVNHSRLSCLEYVAQGADVPLQTLITRMASSGIDVGMLHWRKGDRTWHVIDRPGAPSSLHNSIEPFGRGIAALEGLTNKESDMVIDCHIKGRHVKISGTGRNHLGHVLQLIEPSRDIWLAPLTRLAEPSVRHRPRIDMGTGRFGVSLAAPTMS